jgi:hypothetical protein
MTINVSQFSYRSRSHRKQGLLPTNPFNVVIHRYRQFMTATQAAPFQHFPTIGSCHTLAKAMYTQASVNSWLISPFRHPVSFHFPEVRRWEFSSKIARGYYTPCFRTLTGWSIIS